MKSPHISNKHLCVSRPSDHLALHRVHINSITQNAKIVVDLLSHTGIISMFLFNSGRTFFPTTSSILLELENVCDSQ